VKSADRDRITAERHLLAYEGHVITLTERDRPLADYRKRFPSIVAEPEQIRASLANWRRPVCKNSYSRPVGPDVARELTAFAAATKSRTWRLSAASPRSAQ